jgi:hypothetical protein
MFVCICVNPKIVDIVDMMLESTITDPHCFNTDNNTNCKNCILLKNQLHKALLEVKSTRSVISVLLEDIRNMGTAEQCQVLEPTQCIEHNELDKHSECSESDCNACEVATGGWIPVVHISHKKISKIRKLSPKANLQIVTVSNRYAPLADPKNGVSQKCRKAAVKNQTIGKKHKVFILGDSHMCGCAEIIAELLGNSYSVVGIVKPNARLSTITSSFKLETERLTQKDIVIICGGTHHVAKNEANIGLRSLSKFVERSNNTNVIVMGVPHRYDLQSTSCINNEVNSFNRKLKKALDKYKFTSC